ncbi:MAG: thiol oxidoreductase [Bacteroidetes bacterium]|nr:MAG: thiol oxidoreductase [Bacteroidota bacterium]
MRKIYWITAILLLPAVFMMCRKASEFDESQYDPRLSGGEATVFDETSKAFGHQVPGLSSHDEHVHEVGDGAVEKTFVTAPAPINSGLGPIFSNVSCISCHHNDGKGNPTAGLVNSSLLIRLSVPGSDAHGGPLAVDGYGLQLQDVAVFGVQPEAKINITYTENPFTFPDGETASLRNPTYTLLNPYKPLPGNLMMSPRMAPPFFGLGLIQSIPESTILAFADENDADGDGISGKANYVYDPYLQKTMIGRFGLKANTATILTQVAGAYNQDMGVTNYVFPKESSFGQSQLDSHVDDPEIADSILNAAEFYIRTLAVPARRNVTDLTVQSGENIFRQLNCVGCHKPTIQTGVDLSLKCVSNQRIHPYTDLLLHDMGDGLADGRPDFKADGKEWKTPALWGIGLFEKTNGVPYYLHDGRARTLEEAILWHGGEAEKAKQGFIQLSSTDRKALIKFLKSL